VTAPWILHISDPHLGDVSPGQGLDDEKVQLKGQPDLETTQTVFKRTLQRLAPAVKEHGKPAVVAVSGDLTYRAHADGFDQFAKLLADRADLLPEPGRIVVVPGNHDVVWDKRPGTKPRYANFLAATRAHGCATPLLDGVDFKAGDETGALKAGVVKKPHVVATDELLVVPLNTSNYCGEFVDIRGAWTESEWKNALKPLGADRQTVLAQLKRLRQHDMARVSRPQLAALGELFDALGIARERDDDRVRVCVMHHQLLPVSTREERKTFESLVNLGQVRRTLAEYGFDLVLHGHKHESSLYWDLPSTHSEDLRAPVRRMLVIASPGHFDVGTPTMRALFLDGNGRARNLRVRTFLGAGSAGPLEQGDDQRIALWLGAMEAETSQRTTIRAPGAHVAYARIRSRFELDGPGPVGNFVCEVEDPADAAMLPPDYPDTGFDDPQRWFSELVGWWQRERSELVARGLVSFNHGERIRTRWGDQVARAVKQLNGRENSSRALIVLIAPAETGRYDKDWRKIEEGGTYPAFALAEFSVRHVANKRYLDCFAWFRKQEMQYWWPVNLAEVALLQEEVRAGLKKATHTGRVVTFSAIALWKDALPRVAVPEVDRLIEQPDRLWTLAAALAFPSTAADEAHADWRAVLEDLRGGAREEPPRPKEGLQALGEALERFASLPEAEPLEVTLKAVGDLLNQYAASAEQQTLNRPTADLIRERCDALEAAVEAALGGTS
jgi:predicted MPP superfamily phosphohydrolase